MHALRNRERHAAHRGHRLAKLVVQLARDQMAFAFDVLAEPVGQLAAVGKLQLCADRTAFGFDMALQFADHAVEGVADRSRLGPFQRRQMDVKPPCLHSIQCGDDVPERPHRPPDQPEDQRIGRQQQHERSADQEGDVVPRIEHSA